MGEVGDGDGVGEEGLADLMMCMVMMVLVILTVIVMIMMMTKLIAQLICILDFNLNVKNGWRSSGGSLRQKFNLIDLCHLTFDI